jgi:outer membrane protein
MKKYFIIILAVVHLNFQNIYSQNNSKDSIKSFSLKEAINYALNNSYSVQSAKIDVTISEKKIWETTAIGLPQIGASASYQDMLDIPTTLLPDFISPSVYGVLMQEGVKDRNGNTIKMPAGSDQYFAAKFGTQYNASVKGNLSQLLFNGSYIVGLQASKIYHQLSTQALKKSETDIQQIVSNSYYLVLVLKENKNFLDSTYLIVSRTSEELTEMNKQGFIEETDVDQIKLQKLNIQNSLSSVENQLEVAKKLFKLSIGIDVNQEIILTDDLENLIKDANVQAALAPAFDITLNIDYQLLNTQENLALLNLKREKSTYLPSLAGFYSYQQSAMRDKFDIFDFSKKWYPTSILGLNLDIPIFSSGMRHSRVQQAKLQYIKAGLFKTQVAQGLILDFEQSRNDFNKACDIYHSCKEASVLSGKIYNRTLFKYKNGLSTSTELMQIQNQYFTSQSNYYNSMFVLLGAKCKLDKILAKN